MPRRRRRSVRRYNTRRSSSIGNGCGYILGSILTAPLDWFAKFLRF